MTHTANAAGSSLRRIALLAFVVSPLLLEADLAWAACDCATSTSAPYCSGASVSYTSGSGSTQTVNFGPNGTGSNSYTCGRYANGDFWVLGKGSLKGVEVASTSPAWTGEKHGWMVNPVVNSNKLDSQDGTQRILPYNGPPDALPRTYATGAGPVSFLKGVSRERSGQSTTRYVCSGSEGDLNRSCFKFVGIVTFVDAIPDSDGDGSTADEFRPGYGGARKPGPFNIGAGFASRVAAFPKLSKAGISETTNVTFEKCRDRFRWLQMDHFKTVSELGQPKDNYAGGFSPTFSSYGLSIAHNTSTCMLRAMLEDFSWAPGTASRAFLINFVQYGIDLFSLTEIGHGWNEARYRLGGAGGGIPQGRKLPVAVAAHLLGDAKMQATVAGGSYPSRITKYFYEENEVYSGVGGVPYYGLQASEVAICSVVPFCTGGLGQCAAPGKNMDSMCCSSPEKAYADRSSNEMPFQRLVVTILGLQQTWNHDAYLAYATSWLEGGRSAGHSKFHWCGATSPYSNARVSTVYGNTFAQQMWAAYKNYRPTGQAPAPPAPEPAQPEAPTQIIP